MTSINEQDYKARLTRQSDTDLAKSKQDLLDDLNGRPGYTFFEAFFRPIIGGLFGRSLHETLEDLGPAYIYLSPADEKVARMSLKLIDDELTSRARRRFPFALIRYTLVGYMFARLFQRLTGFSFMWIMGVTAINFFNSDPLSRDFIALPILSTPWFPGYMFAQFLWGIKSVDIEITIQIIIVCVNVVLNSIDYYHDEESAYRILHYLKLGFRLFLACWNTWWTWESCAFMFERIFGPNPSPLHIRTVGWLMAFYLCETNIFANIWYLVFSFPINAVLFPFGWGFGKRFYLAWQSVGEALSAPPFLMFGNAVAKDIRLAKFIQLAAAHFWVCFNIPLMYAVAHQRLLMIFLVAFILPLALLCADRKWSSVHSCNQYLIGIVYTLYARWHRWRAERFVEHRRQLHLVHLNKRISDLAGELQDQTKKYEAQILVQNEVSARRSQAQQEEFLRQYEAQKEDFLRQSEMLKDNHLTQINLLKLQIDESFAETEKFRRINVVRTQQLEQIRRRRHLPDLGVLDLQHENEKLARQIEILRSELHNKDAENTRLQKEIEVLCDTAF